jgi:WD40 repeat protein
VKRRGIPAPTKHEHSTTLGYKSRQGGSNDQTIQLWDIGTGECCAGLKGHSEGIWAIAFDANGALYGRKGWVRSLTKGTLCALGAIERF